MKLQGKDSGEYAGIIGWIDPDHSPIDPRTGVKLLTVQYKDAGVNCYKDYETIAEFNADWEDYTPEPGPSYLIAKIQQLENSVKELDERLKTAEEITERLLREDNEQILGGKVKRYEPGMPQSVVFERMKQDLRDWIEKNEIGKIRVFHYSDPAGRRGVLFKDKTNKGENTLVLIGWPTIGLRDGGTYTPDELLITGEAGKE